MVLFLTGVLIQPFVFRRPPWISGDALYRVTAYLAFQFLSPAEVESRVNLRMVGRLSVSSACIRVCLSARPLCPLAFGVADLAQVMVEGAFF